ncbi:nitrate reductase [Cyathus striatus]|nr:nitrate reductase [Cyathus striatus]
MSSVSDTLSQISSSLSSSASESGSYTPESSPPTSPAPIPDVKHTFGQDCTSKQGEIKLPTPFFPPSLVRNGTLAAACTIPRVLPQELELPPVPLEAPCDEVDPQDVATPDSWINRDPRLVRLTGKHPFNSEAKLKDLYSAGFLTPSNLFFVRNHGAVPRIDYETASQWTVEIHGLCNNPTIFTLHDLRSKFQVVTVPVTLVCAGNRRKEQNIVQKSLGFSWGAAGVSTALFTGVYLSDVLDYVTPAKIAKHVIFEGCDKLPNGPYGTSQLLSWARDKRKGMLLSWAMNGVPLEPDHGFPLRLVVPSQIGGRSVKWLSHIELSKYESQHHLHFHDNKVLPMPVDADKARAENDWWYDPRYIIRDLNVNSAIASPDHEEILETADKADSDVFATGGYAYAGGGRRVTRVEISCDDGSTWSLADIQYPEDAYRDVAFEDDIYGTLDLTSTDTCLCWCFWTFNIPYGTLKGSRSISVRCMDESLALQPRDMYWNATGMMNNWWFRVCIHHIEGGRLQFEHPTMAGTQPGGWMQRLKDESMNPAKPSFAGPTDLVSENRNEVKKSEVIPMVKDGVQRKISIEEFEKHKSTENPWFVVNGEVYDGTGFLKDHPGGPESITLVAGEDATEDFMAIHSTDAKKQLVDYHIGTLAGKLETGTDQAQEYGMNHEFLHPKKWKKVVLGGIQAVSKDSKVYHFTFGSNDQALGLPTGQHVYVRLRRKVKHEDSAEVVEGELVQRAYTPLSRPEDKGFIDMLVKIYYPNEKFPQGGRMTLGFAELEIGDHVEIKGPIGHFTWLGHGRASLHGAEQRVKEIAMICAGSGVTPILQVLRAVLNDSASEDEKTRVWVLDINRHLDDILCKEELDGLAVQHRERFQLRYSLTGMPAPADWDQSLGRIDDAMLKYLPSPIAESLTCICGPLSMEQSTKGEE